MLHGRLLLLDRSRIGRLRQARRSVAPCAMLRYLLLLANPAQLFPVNPGKAEQTSRSSIVLRTHYEHADGRGRCVSLRKTYFEPDAYVIDCSRLHQACRLPVLRCRRNCFDLAESENGASRATGIIRLNDRQMKSAFAPAPPTCPANAWPHAQLLASDDEGTVSTRVKRRPTSIRVAKTCADCR